MIESYKHFTPKFPNIGTNASGNLSTTSGDLHTLFSLAPRHSSTAVSTNGLQVGAWHTEVCSFLPSIGWLPFDLLRERGFELCGHCMRVRGSFSFTTSDKIMYFSFSPTEVTLFLKT